MSTDTVETPPAPAKRSPFQRSGFWIVALLIVAAIAVAGFLYWQHSRQFESTDDAFVDAHVVWLAPEVAGTLIQVADVDNKHVRRGELLALIKPSGPEAQLAESQAGVAQAQAQLETARAQVTAAEAARAQAVANARAPLAEAERAAQDLARYQELQRIDAAAVAGQQLDAARAAARQTAASAAAAQSAIRNAAAQVEVADRNVRAAQAQIEARQAQVRQANVTVGNLRLEAPVDGHVFNRSVDLGSYVAPGTALMSIVPDHIWVTANFKETQLTHIRPGQPVDIKVDAFPGVTFKGTVDSIQRAAGQAQSILPAQNATGNFVKVVQRVPVRIEFDLKNGPDPRRYPIGPGMSVVPTVKVR
ncbi:MAG: HlyD family secretion protein [Sphingomonas sp.]|uniref:HlyD family secretion protein n=1 Tax=Sphingomonas sp. TaxID=28214 RepID=UPI0025CC49E3|nr:HlyD family secretion protein [Sphingomonas sp.]MBX9881175.1 HlyD family secretion protein [Sphingomonas sp.]